MSGTNYIRQSTFTDGDIITAALFNNEYNQIQNAFVYAAIGTTGHRHDGTSGQGGNIHTIGDQDFDNKIVVDSTNNRWGFFVSVSNEPVEQIRIQDGAIVPVTDNDIDLGTSSLEFKDIYIDGTAYVDSISFNGTVISATATELNTLDGITSTVAELNILDGVTATTTELNYTDGVTSSIQTQIDTKAPTASPTFTGTLTAPTINASTSLEIAGTALTVTAAELNILDGVTATTAELNALDGITATVSELNILDGVTATTAELNALDGITATVAELNALDGITATVSELNILDGVTATTAELNALDGITATVTELNLLDGVTATTAEINYLDGVTSSIQSQLSGLQGSDQSLVDISGISHSNGVFIVSDGTNWVGESGSTVITSLGITSTATELNLLDGVTATTVEINYLDGVTSSIQTQLNAKGVGSVTSVGGTGTVSGLTLTGTVTGSGNLTLGGTLDNINLASGVTGTLPITNGGTGGTSATAALTNFGLTATVAEINVLDGIPAGLTATELGYVDGVTSAIQTQLNAKGTVSTLSDLSITATAAELNYTDGVTSAIQTQLNAKDNNPIQKGANYTAVVGDNIIATAGGITITLPASPSAGDTVGIKDGTGAAATTTFTVARNGSKIASSATDLVFDKNFAEITMSYVNATIGWSV